MSVECVGHCAGKAPKHIVGKMVNKKHSQSKPFSIPMKNKGIIARIL